MKRCPYCPFEGTDAEVDDHRVVHRDEPQKGSNEPGRKR